MPLDLRAVYRAARTPRSVRRKLVLGAVLAGASTPAAVAKAIGWPSPQSIANDLRYWQRRMALTRSRRPETAILHIRPTRRALELWRAV